MSDLLILGTGPHAIEMLDIVDRINRAENRWNFLGFVSSDSRRVGETLLGFPVLSEQMATDQYPQAQLVPEYEWPFKVRIPLDRLTSLIDPSVFVSRTAHIGQGCVIYPHCYVGSHARIGDFLFCLAGSVINHNDVIGDRVTITSGVMVAGDVHVESDCYLGQGATVREMLRVGHDSLIGMGSVVVDNVVPNSVIVGNPGRRLRSRVNRFLGARFAQAAKRAARKGVRITRQESLRIRERLFGAAT